MRKRRKSGLYKPIGAMEPTRIPLWCLNQTHPWKSAACSHFKKIPEIRTRNEETGNGAPARMGDRPSGWATPRPLARRPVCCTQPAGQMDPCLGEQVGGRKQGSRGRRKVEDWAGSAQPLERAQHGSARVSSFLCDFGQGDLLKSHFSQGQSAPKNSTSWGYCSMQWDGRGQAPRKVAGTRKRCEQEQ